MFVFPQAAVLCEVKVLQVTSDACKQEIHPISFPFQQLFHKKCYLSKCTSSFRIPIVGVKKTQKLSNYFASTFVVKEPLHLHGRSGMSDTEHGAGHDALLGRGAVCSPDQAPVWFVVKSLQNLHGLTSAHSQLPIATTVAGHKVMDHHRQLTSSRELEKTNKNVVKMPLFYLKRTASID